MPLMPHPVLEEKLYTKLAFSETQGRAVRARESPNDEGKTRPRIGFFFASLSPSRLDFLLSLLSVEFQRVQCKTGVGMFLQPRLHIDELIQSVFNFAVSCQLTDTTTSV